MRFRGSTRRNALRDRDRLSPSDKRSRGRSRCLPIELLEARHLLTIDPVAWGDSTVDEGAPFVLGLDPGSASLTQWSIDWDGNGPLAAETFSGTALQASHAYPDGSPTGTAYAIAASATDGTTTWNLAAHDVTVIDVAPILNMHVEGFESTTAQVAEGQEFRLFLTVEDPGDDTLGGWTIDWGDGTTPQTVSGSPEYVAHTYADNPTAGHFTITASASDEDGTYYLPLAGDPGDLDTSFGDDGRVMADFGGGDDHAYSAALDAQGRIVAAGTANSDFAVARYLSTDELDITFGDEGLARSLSGYRACPRK
jgi:hypothetical protein